MTRQTIGVAMSGGVDSTMAASLLLEQGHAVRGFFMRLPLAQALAQEQRAIEMAGLLNIPVSVIDLSEPFTRSVIDYFTRSYRAGLTPNPCIRCNAAIKFGLLAEAMRAAGMERIATGHYARVREEEQGPALLRGIDPGKDQSYFLARLTAGQLKGVCFPLGEWSKQRVRNRARVLGFPFSGEESQDVCFLDQGLAAFLRARGVEDRPGAIVTEEGSRIGEHRGVWHYTIGQRRGLGLPDATPWYVTALDGAANRVVVGKKESLWQDGCPLHELQWMSPPPPLPWLGQVQLRSRHAPTAARLEKIAGGGWRLFFREPQRAVTPGQFAVFYEGERVAGSAVIGTTTEEGA